MARGAADVLEVVVLAAGAHAFLRGRGARVIARLAAEERVFELIHPGVREKQRGIAGRHERRAGDAAVAVFLEIREELFTNLTDGEQPGSPSMPLE
jgi:hypothetical protein